MFLSVHGKSVYCDVILGGWEACYHMGRVYHGVFPTVAYFSPSLTLPPTFQDISTQLRTHNLTQQRKPPTLCNKAKLYFQGILLA